MLESTSSLITSGSIWANGFVKVNRWAIIFISFTITLGIFDLERNHVVLKSVEELDVLIFWKKITISSSQRAQRCLKMILEQTTMQTFFKFAYCLFFFLQIKCLRWRKIEIEQPRIGWLIWWKSSKQTSRKI